MYQCDAGVVGRPILITFWDSALGGQTCQLCGKIECALHGMLSQVWPHAMSDVSCTQHAGGIMWSESRDITGSWSIILFVDKVCHVRQTSISLPFITATADGPKHIETNLSRAKFEEISSDLLDRCRIPVQQALKDANLSFSDLNEVILVGGSTRIPAVQVCLT